MKNSNLPKRLLISTVLLFLFSIELSYSQSKSNPESREKYIDIAGDHFRKGEWEAGKKVVDNGLKKYPKDSDMKMLLGKYHFEKKDHDAARYELVKALEYNKHNVGAKHLLVNVEITSKRYSSAICYVNELLEVNPYWKGLWIKKIEVYKLQGNHVEANRQLKRLCQIYPEDEQLRKEYLYSTEQELVASKKEGKLSNAIEFATLLSENSPSNEYYHIEIINNELKSGDYGKALINVEKGLFYLPDNINLINKKVDILGELQRYDEALSFMRLKMKDGAMRSNLNKKYSYLLEESARHHRKSDPYVLYGEIFQQNPRNEEAFNYIFNTALSRSLFEDALEVIKRSEAVKGTSKELSLKKHLVYERMGDQSKANQMVVQLYQSYPQDHDIAWQYTYYRFREGKSFMEDGFYAKALNHLGFVTEHGDEELKNASWMSIYNCSFQLSKWPEALNALEQLIKIYPDEGGWYAKKASIYGKQKKYSQALKEYEEVISLTPSQDKDQAIEGYDELATIYTKQLIEIYRLDEALMLLDHWLEINPGSEQAIRYAINISAQVNNYDGIMKYASLGLNNSPGNLYYQIKLSEALNVQKKHKQAFEMLAPEIRKMPYHKELSGAYSQAGEDYAKYLINQSQYQESISVLDSTIAYNPSNKMLKYWKGVAYEKLKIYDSACYYQSFYEPSFAEAKSFENHLRLLKQKTYHNQAAIYYLRSRQGNNYAITSIATLEYSRFEKNNTYTGRVNYAGKTEGKGIQGELEWHHIWKPDVYTRFNVAVSNQFFPSVITTGSVYKSLGHNWEIELGGGYRKMYTHENLFNMVGGIAKEADPWWINVRYNSLLLESMYYYNLMAQVRFYLNTPKSYLVAMGSVGSAPDADIIDYDLYTSFSTTNSMVGAGIQQLISDRLSVGLLGNWYNYKDHSKNYQNLYNLYVQLYVSF